MMDMAKQDRIGWRLRETLNCTRAELKALVGIVNEEEFDGFIAELKPMLLGLQVRAAGTDGEWYYLSPSNGGSGAGPL
jgi:hypothetical protein